MSRKQKLFFFSFFFNMCFFLLSLSWTVLRMLWSRLCLYLVEIIKSHRTICSSSNVLCLYTPSWCINASSSLRRALFCIALLCTNLLIYLKKSNQIILHLSSLYRLSEVSHLLGQLLDLFENEFLSSGKKDYSSSYNIWLVAVTFKLMVILKS